MSALVLVAAGNAAAAEFSEEIEKDFALRSRGQLQVTNMRGDISVQGWALDRIRVRARRLSVADTPEEARRNADAAGFKFEPSGSTIELSAEYGQGLSLEERLRERSHPRTRLEMTVFAPASLPLRVWAVDGKVSVHGWKSGVDVRTSSGAISLESVAGDSIMLLCPSCSVTARTIRGAFRCMGGDGSIDLSDVKSPQVYVETGSGALHASGVEGDQLYVSESGDILGDRLRGRIEFHAKSGKVEILHGSGFLSGRSATGDIRAGMTDWSFVDKAFIESASGNIQLTLPAGFSGEVDFQSGSGRVESGFPVHVSDEKPVPGSAGTRRIQGRIGNGGELLKILSEKGSIRVLRGI